MTSNRRGLCWVALVPVAMFALGFAIAPLYSLFCEAVGLEAAVAARAPGHAPRVAPQARAVTVRFDTNVPSDMPWDFVVDQSRIEVHPGAPQEMTFRVRNRSDTTIVGRAIPTVVPWQAAPHFIKTECFCFRDQAIGPGETRELVVRFQVTPELPEEIGALTLSYTFLRHDTVATGDEPSTTQNNPRG